MSIGGIAGNVNKSDSAISQTTSQSPPPGMRVVTKEEKQSFLQRAQLKLRSLFKREKSSSVAPIRQPTTVPVSGRSDSVVTSANEFQTLISYAESPNGDKLFREIEKLLTTNGPNRLEKNALNKIKKACRALGKEKTNEHILINAIGELNRQLSLINVENNQKFEQIKEELLALQINRLKKPGIKSVWQKRLGVVARHLPRFLTKSGKKPAKPSLKERVISAAKKGVTGLAVGVVLVANNPIGWGLLAAGLALGGTMVLFNYYSKGRKVERETRLMPGTAAMLAKSIGGRHTFFKKVEAKHKASYIDRVLYDYQVRMDKLLHDGQEKVASRWMDCITCFTADLFKATSEIEVIRAFEEFGDTIDSFRTNAKPSKKSIYKGIATAIRAETDTFRQICKKNKLDKNIGRNKFRDAVLKEIQRRNGASKSFGAISLAIQAIDDAIEPLSKTGKLGGLRHAVLTRNNREAREGGLSTDQLYQHYEKYLELVAPSSASKERLLFAIEKNTDRACVDRIEKLMKEVELNPNMAMRDVLQVVIEAKAPDVDTSLITAYLEELDEALGEITPEDRLKAALIQEINMSEDETQRQPLLRKIIAKIPEEFNEERTLDLIAYIKTEEKEFKQEGEPRLTAAALGRLIADCCPDIDVSKVDMPGSVSEIIRQAVQGASKASTLIRSASQPLLRVKQAVVSAGGSALRYAEGSMPPSPRRPSRRRTNIAECLEYAKINPNQASIATLRAVIAANKATGEVVVAEIREAEAFMTSRESLGTATPRETLEARIVQEQCITADDARVSFLNEVWKAIDEAKTDSKIGEVISYVSNHGTQLKQTDDPVRLTRLKLVELLQACRSQTETSPISILSDEIEQESATSRLASRRGSLANLSLALDNMKENPSLEHRTAFSRVVGLESPHLSTREGRFSGLALLDNVDDITVEAREKDGIEEEITRLKILKDGLATELSKTRDGSKQQAIQKIQRYIEHIEEFDTMRHSLLDVVTENAQPFKKNKLPRLTETRLIQLAEKYSQSLLAQDRRITPLERLRADLVKELCITDSVRSPARGEFLAALLMSIQGESKLMTERVEWLKNQIKQNGRRLKKSESTSRLTADKLTSLVANLKHEESG